MPNENSFEAIIRLAKSSQSVTMPMAQMKKKNDERMSCKVGGGQGDHKSFWGAVISHNNSCTPFLKCSTKTADHDTVPDSCTASCDIYCRRMSYRRGVVNRY